MKASQESEIPLWSRLLFGVTLLPYVLYLGWIDYVEGELPKTWVVIVATYCLGSGVPEVYAVVSGRAKDRSAFLKAVDFFFGIVAVVAGVLLVTILVGNTFFHS